MNDTQTNYNQDFIYRGTIYNKTVNLPCGPLNRQNINNYMNPVCKTPAVL